MTKRDIIWRVIGAFAIGGAGGTSLLHREVSLATAGASPALAELLLGLSSFVLASVGVLLLIHGARLHENRRQEPGFARAPNKSPYPGLFGEDRVAMDLYLAWRERAKADSVNSQNGRSPYATRQTEARR